MRDEIDRAIECLSARDGEGALAALVSAWRSAKAPELADLIDELSLQVDSRSRRPKGKSVTERHEAWLVLANKNTPSAADVAALLATFDSEGQRPELRPRLDSIAEWPADPRVATHLMKMVTAPRLRANDAWSSFWAKVLDVILATGDTRVIAMRKDTEGLFWGRRRPGKSRWISESRLNEVFDLLTTQHAADAKLRARLAPAITRVRGALDGPKGTSKGSATELFHAVYTKPDDDTARSVLADVLQELGDPRGELIALQLSNKEKRSPKREKALLKEHITSWLGPLAPVVVEKTAVFERGFLDSCAIACKQRRVADEAIEHPEWATVRAISLFSGGPSSWDHPFTPLLRSKHAKSLREVRYFPVHEIDKLGEEPLRLTKVHFPNSGDVLLARLGQWEHLFPDLRDFDVGYFGAEEAAEAHRYFTSLMSLVLTKRVEVLRANTLYDSALHELFKAAQAAKDLKATCVIATRTDENNGWQWSLSRDAKGKLSRLEGIFAHKGYRSDAWRRERSPLGRAEALIAALAASLTSVTLSSATAQAADQKSLDEQLASIRRVASSSVECTFDLSAKEQEA